MNLSNFSITKTVGKVFWNSDFGIRIVSDACRLMSVACRHICIIGIKFVTLRIEFPRG
jgi:hypothetical protein